MFFVLGVIFCPRGCFFVFVFVFVFVLFGCFKLTLTKKPLIVVPCYVLLLMYLIYGGIWSQSLSFFFSILLPPPIFYVFCFFLFFYLPFGLIAVFLVFVCVVFPFCRLFLFFYPIIYLFTILYGIIPQVFKYD